MKKMLLVLLSITFLVSVLFMASCQKKEEAKTEETVTETSKAEEPTVTETPGYGEKAEEATVTETPGYGEKAEEAAGK